ncbi:MAG: hypothetical protein WDN31_06175 [Hyphomicrobium sp.]
MSRHLDDEGDSAQRATLDGTSFVAGDPVPLVGESDRDVAFGTRPQVDCPNGDGDFGELDGEAVAFAAPYYYVVGSHGCSRKKGEFRAFLFHPGEVERWAARQDRNDFPSHGRVAPRQHRQCLLRQGPR